MAEQQETDAAMAPSRQPPLKLDDKGIYICETQDDEFRVASILLKTGAVNASLKNPVQVMVALQAVKSVGLNPYTAMRQVGFINGALTFYGDLELGIVRMSGLLTDKEEFLYVIDAEGKATKRCFENSNLHLPAAGAVCRMWRKGQEHVEETSFSVEDAKASGLWQRTPVWRNYPGRMMQMRARGLCIRNAFSDVTQGMATQEYDMEGIDYGRGQGVHSQHAPGDERAA